jgi:hypothetical protein
MSLILETKDKDALGIAHERFRKGDITSFVIVTVDLLGNTEVSYDVNGAVKSQAVPLLNKLGGGLMAALEALRSLAIDEKIKSNIQRGQNPFKTN